MATLLAFVGVASAQQRNGIDASAADALGNSNSGTQVDLPPGVERALMKRDMSALMHLVGALVPGQTADKDRPPLQNNH
jgi:hypothetical protein